MRSRERTSGFTLLELLVVMAILGLTLVITIPALSSGDQLRLDSAARSLAAGLRKTRSLATIMNQPQKLTFDLTRQTFELPGGREPTRLPPGTEIIFLTARSQLIHSSKASVQFFSDGSSTGGRITLKKQDRQVVIDIDWLTGRVKVFFPDAETS